MQQSSTENQLPNESPPILGYAEPSTAEKGSLLRSIGRNWLLLGLSSVLFFALLFIGGTVGSLYLDLGPARPWVASVRVIDLKPGKSAADFAAIKNDRDMLAAAPLQRVYPSSYWQPLHAIADDEFAQAVRVSAVQQDGSFNVDINSRTQEDCAALLDDYSNVPLRMQSLVGHPIQVAPSLCEQSDAAKRAPVLGALTGMGIGLLAAIVIIWVSMTQFRRESRQAALARLADRKSPVG